jgi:hypothetical protein
MFSNKKSLEKFTEKDKDSLAIFLTHFLLAILGTGCLWPKHQKWLGILVAYF